MRILHVLFSSHIAGSERYCIDLANRQAALGHKVHVAGKPNVPIANALAVGVQFHEFSPLFRGYRFRRLVRQLRPDICHGHLSAACKALKGLPTFQRAVATLHVGYKPHQHAWFDGLICVNRAQRNRLSGYRGLARTISNWIPLAPPPSTARGIRAELGIGDEVFLIGSVGRLHESKGMDILIAAFRSWAPASAALIILGEGRQRVELEKLRKGDPRIHLLGYRASIYECLHDLDLFVSPSREESFGLAILEAMSAGLPIIATNTDGPAEFLRDQPATLVPIGEVETLAIEMAAAHQRFCSDGLARIDYDLELFDPDARVADIMEFYREVTGACSPGTIRQKETATVPA